MKPSETGLFFMMGILSYKLADLDDFLEEIYEDVDFKVPPETLAAIAKLRDTVSKTGQLVAKYFDSKLDTGIVGREELLAMAIKLNSGISAIDEYLAWLGRLERRDVSLLRTLDSAAEKLDNLEPQKVIRALRELRNAMVRPGATDLW